MKYVCVDYDPNANKAEVLIVSDSIISNVFTIHDQMFVTYRDRNYAVLYASEYDNQIRDFSTVMRLGYQGLKVEMS